MALGQAASVSRPHQTHRSRGNHIQGYEAHELATQADRVRGLSTSHTRLFAFDCVQELAQNLQVALGVVLHGQVRRILDNRQFRARDRMTATLEAMSCSGQTPSG